MKTGSQRDRIFFLSVENVKLHNKIYIETTVGDFMELKKIVRRDLIETTEKYNKIFAYKFLPRYGNSCSR